MAEKQVTRIESNYMKQYDTYVERQHRKKKRLFRRLALFTILVLVVMGSMLTYHFKQQAMYNEKLERMEELQEQKVALENQEKNLKEEIELLNNEEYVLQIARTNYFFSKEGEIIFKLPEEDPSY
ncbi:cell division protein DIVIC [Thalassobacillus devorans]|uniref:Cell division protein DIVIC n=1 Tax=Thalassobacillus devorans TaxID=279813 RepID=A0ABQ1PV25_9BACI|nr:septum formation initiator family protein [Thalassobacillus devorans]NIK30810.1 cell division protein DivIC [Thalassobacillus devorans]GGD04416.1 cell division protein DIVIC [Thalassobacillus devorans]